VNERKTDDEVRGWPVAEVAANRRLVADMLATHVDDGEGRCGECAVDPTLRPAWPCAPRVLAEKADDAYRRFRPAP
jgi:hypothetical protein